MWPLGQDLDNVKERDTDASTASTLAHNDDIGGGWVHAVYSLVTHLTIRLACCVDTFVSENARGIPRKHA